MLIAQLSDTHVVADDAREIVGVAPNRMLARAVDAVNELDPQPDVVLVTGDLTDHGAVDEYRRLAELLAPLAPPWFVAIGNHDERAAMLEVLGGEPCLPVTVGFVHYAIDDAGPVRIVVGDTNLDGRHDGGMCDERIAWLDHALAASDRPTLVALHHPPFDTGIFWMDGGGFHEGRDALLDVLGRHPHVLAVVCGHQHRPISARIGGVTIACAPSTAHQVALCLRYGAPPAFTHEPPGFSLHRFDGAHLVTHTAPVLRNEPIPLGGGMPEEIWADVVAMMERHDPLPKPPTRAARDEAGIPD